ncbi:TrkH family potassium uptake protein [Chloroflexota bacterium]
MATTKLNTNEQKQPVRKPGDRFFRVPRVTQVHIPILPVQKPKIRKLSPMLLVYGFAIVIALGTLLLALPVSSKSGDFTSFVHAFFTSTSAVCVTGLVVVDTGDYWSSFGQAVILVLIQIGGFGFMTSATLFLLIMVRRIGLRERLLIGESMGLTRLGGLGSLVMKIAIFTLIAEGVGATLFYIRFSIDDPAGTALWKSVFQSISAFNNAGFDIFGSFKSMADYNSDILVMLVTTVLIILGGISFLVFADIFKVRDLSRMTLDSKLVIYTTVTLLILGTVVVLSAEFSDSGTLGVMALPKKLLNAFFQSVTARTAGFSTINMASVSDYTLFFTMILMFIGGAAGSTAGGIKVNTFGMLISIIWSTMRGKEYAGAYGREFKTQQINRVLTVVMLSLGLIAIIVFVLTITEDFRFLNLLFETVSAYGTVGLSTGITPDLSIAGKLVITITMFVGRLGSLALALSLLQRQKQSGCRYPQESIRIG